MSAPVFVILYIPIYVERYIYMYIHMCNLGSYVSVSRSVSMSASEPVSTSTLSLYSTPRR